MRLPSLPYADGIVKSQQVKFGGLNHTRGAGDGELWAMRNLTSDDAPLLSTRPRRLRYQTLAEPGGLFSCDGLVWVDGDGFYYRGARKGTVTPGKKTFAAMGAYIVILPDKAYYNRDTDAFGSLEAAWSGSALSVTGSTLAPAAGSVLSSFSGTHFSLRMKKTETEPLTDVNVGYLKTYASLSWNDETKTWTTTDEREYCLLTYQDAAKLRGRYVIPIKKDGGAWGLNIRQVSGTIGAWEDTVPYAEDNGEGICGVITAANIRDAAEDFYNEAYASDATLSVEVRKAMGTGLGAHFSVGDAVTISGCTQHPENNKTSIIQAISGDTLTFYDNVFTVSGSNAEIPYTETGELTVKRAVPELRFLCENENRLWGCDGDTIYASKLGDPFNWNVFNGLSTDSYSVKTGSAGAFTGCISFLGYPIFFKEDHIYKVYGSVPSNFEVMGSAALGVARGCENSLAIAGETLFYLSRAGVAAYSGGAPRPIGEALGPGRFEQAAAGSDGLKYYVSTKRELEGWALYVYDTQAGLWHMEDETQATHFARWDGNLYMLTDTGEVWVVGRPTGCSEEDGEWEDPVRWLAEFGDFTEGDPNKKGVSKIQLRLELDPGATARVFIRFDTGDWQPVSTALGGTVKRSYYLPIIPRRGDHYRLKLEGIGGCRVYSMARESYSGSELKSKAGRQ